VIAAVTTLVLGGGAAVAAQQVQEEEVTPIDEGTTPAESGQEDETTSETPEKLAKVDRAAVALDAFPGEVREAKLENEGGFAVYEVVGTGNGEVLGQEIEADEGPEEDAR
jgi:uncharacterized membrane protein YkoI